MLARKSTKKHEKKFLSGTILEKEIEKVQSKKWILGIDDQGQKLLHFSTYVHVSEYLY